MRRFRIFCAAALTIAAAAPGSEQAVTFTSYDARSSNAVLAERLVTPLAAELTRRDMAARGQRLAEQPINLAEESFRLFVPADQPAAGYGLLVFVPPWPEATIPSAWKGPLAKRGLIMVTMARAGNAEPVLGRRDPLAILAAVGTMQRYRIDPARVYIGGFSGGSKVAQRLALGYPDLFRGALLLAGADPLGGDGLAPPSLALYTQFRLAGNVVMVTGAQDAINLEQARTAAAALRQFCVRPAAALVVPGLSHELVGESWFGSALDRLDRPAANPSDAGAVCESKLLAEASKALDAVEALLAKGQRDAARRKLLAIDARYGGLALPRSLQLLRKIDGI